MGATINPAVFVILLALVSYFPCLRTMDTVAVLRFSNKNCQNVADEPVTFSLDDHMLVTEPWRVYYYWAVETADFKKCVEMVFEYATAAAIRRFYDGMSEFLADQPDWDNATLVATLGQKFQLLFFQDPTIHGRFYAVPNVAKELRLTRKNSIPLLQYQLRMIDGNFLLFMSCEFGMAVLATKASQPPYRADVDKVVVRVPIVANGNHACETGLKENDELVGFVGETGVLKGDRSYHKG